MKESGRTNLVCGPVLWSLLLARSVTGQTTNAPSVQNAAPSSGVPAVASLSPSTAVGIITAAPSPGNGTTGLTTAPAIATATPSYSPTLSEAPAVTTASPTFADRDCWDNFTQIFYDLVQKVPFSENTYTICPNRVYPVGYAYDDNQCCRDGDFPLVPRANTHFKCGKDGSLSNNCTLIGGSFHVLFNEFVYQEALSGVKVQGFTFQSPELHTVQAAATGSLTFIDCVIKDQVNRGPIFTFYDRPERRLNRAGGVGGIMVDTARERLGYAMSDEYIKSVQERMQQRTQKDSASAQHSRERRAQGITQTIAMERCIFMNCSQGGHSENIPPSYGVASAITPDNIFVITNSVFAGNTYDGTTQYGQTGYAVSMINSDLVMTNSCFIDNNFAGYGTVQVFGNASFKVTNNFVTGTDAGIHCQFISQSSTIPSNPADTTCTDADATSCQAGSTYQTWLALRPDQGSPTAAPSASQIRPTAAPAPVTSGVSMTRGSLLCAVVSLLSLVW